MNVFEMHLQVNQRLQEVASYKRDKFFPQEIDMALNKAMFRLFEKAVEAKFEDTQINLSHVAALIQKNKISEVYIPSTVDKLYEENLLSVYSVIPPDLCWNINLRAEVITDPVNCSTAPTLTTTTKNEYVAVVAFPALGSAPYFANTSVTSSTLGTLYTSPTAIASGFQSSNSKYVVVNNIIEKLYRANPNVRVYWERYRDVYQQNSFIFVGDVSLGTVTVTSNAQSTAVINTIVPYTIYNRAAISSITNKTVAVKPVELSEENLLYSTLKLNSFYATESEQPVGDQTHDYFIVYRDESFLVTRLYYDYIRKPRTISLVLAQDCELASTAHHKIIDLAVELLRLDIKDPAYPQTVQDTQNRTN